MGNERSKVKVLKVWNKTGGRCWYCGVETLPAVEAVYGSSLPECSFVIDHVNPVASGGSGRISNLVPSCRMCNGKKGKKSIEQFRAFLSWALVGVDRFTDTQVRWLEQHGIDLPTPPPIEFYFEREGIEP